MLPLNTNYYNHFAVSEIFLFLFFISSTYIIPAVVYAFWSLSSSFRRMSCNLYPQENPARHYTKKCRMHFAPSKTEGKPFTLSFWTTRKKVCKERVADTALSANSSSIPMVLTSILCSYLAYFYMAFSSSHPVLIQKPRRSPLRRSKLLLYVIAVNTLCL